MYTIITKRKGENNMFAYIKGTLEIKGNDYVVIDVGGLGYKVNAPLSTIEKLRRNWLHRKSTYALLCSRGYSCFVWFL